MTENSYDVVGIGNAIVDVLAHADDSFLSRHKMAKGAMTLIEAPVAEALYASMGPAIECSGGSVANSMAGIASLGGRAAYIGKVADDQLGSVFAHDIRATGVTFAASPIVGGPPTARCLVLVTPDGQRTMHTYLGAATHIGPEDIDAALIKRSKIVYMEGYLWDPPRAKEAIRRAATLAREAKRLVAFTLSDPFCVDRHRAEFMTLAEKYVDVLFANEAEIISLYQAPDFAAAVEQARRRPGLSVLTRSEKGSLVVAGSSTHEIAAEKVGQVVDSTGAGDLYAAGFLYGLTQGYDLPVCGRIGSIAAAEAISHLGARPEAPLATLIERKLGRLAPGANANKAVRN